MANIVMNHIYVRKAHKNALQALENIFETIGDNSLAFSDILPEWETDRYPDIEWCEKNLGTKHATATSVDIDISTGIVNIEIDSEWSPIKPFFMRLCNILEEIDEDVEIGMLYRDEFNNFDGHLLHAHGELVVNTHFAENVKLDEDNG